MKIELYSGLLIDPIDPRPEDFTLEDICMGLSNLCRFGGHCNKFYSVLHHTINCYHESVARGYNWDQQRLVWIHDFSEGLGCVDVPRPLKEHLTSYYDIEDKFQECVYDKFGIVRNKENLTKLNEIDFDMAVYEGRILLPSAASDGRWSKPTVSVPCDTVFNNIQNVPSRRESLDEFWDICLKLDIYDSEAVA